MTLLLLVAVGTAVGVGYTLWGLTEVLPAQQQSTLRVEVVKTSLAVAAGTSGIGALVIAVRRQWLSERAQQHIEQEAVLSRHHAELVAADARIDATEKRITDLYAKSAELLGSDRPSVALAGLYSLERLGQNYEQHRQTIVDLICGFIRISSREDQAGSVMPGGELLPQAMRVLARHIRPATQGDYWGQLTLDLSYSRLHGVDFSDCALTGADFTGTEFLTEANFSRSQLYAVKFDKAVFQGHAEFSDSQPFKFTRFTAVRFMQYALFSKCNGPVGLIFEGCQFDSNFDLTKANLGGLLVSDCQILGPFSCRDITTDGQILISDCNFTQSAISYRTRAAMTRFFGCTFAGVVNLDDTPGLQLELCSLVAGGRYEGLDCVVDRNSGQLACVSQGGAQGPP